LLDNLEHALGSTYLSAALTGRFTPTAFSARAKIEV